MEVLVVEAAPLLRRLLAELVEEAGLPPALEAADAEQALVLLSRPGGPRPAALIIGLRPPGASRGRELVRHLAVEGHPRPVLLHVGASRALLGVEALEPREGFLSPPFGAACLGRTLLRLMGQSPPPWLRPRPRRGVER